MQCLHTFFGIEVSCLNSYQCIFWGFGRSNCFGYSRSLSLQGADILDQPRTYSCWPGYCSKQTNESFSTPNILLSQRKVIPFGKCLIPYF
ncbi:hypothetical protein RJT34_13618 [Clitoria ternatea]|uniref:Uncharacterized protein n=1 Tax=Clitoria ternatea TaxID=43366 RepID=A0AAN9JRV7_CLITE